jgi:hypothetical protein
MGVSVLCSKDVILVGSPREIVDREAPPDGLLDDRRNRWMRELELRRLKPERELLAVESRPLAAP